jgi:hypothetical protein
MTTLRHRRRAERFAQLLDEAAGGRRQRRRTPHDDELAELVALPSELASRDLGPAIDPEFRTGLRAMLVATAEREGIGVTAATDPPTRKPSTGPHRRPLGIAGGPRARTAAIAGVAVGAVAFAGMSTASENAVPGDALYGVKRSTERAQLALASSEVGRGQLYLGFARTRLEEAQLLASDLERVLDDMDRDTSQGVRLLNTAAANRHDRAALDVIEAFVDDQRRPLRQLAGEVSAGDLHRVTESLELLDTIELRAQELRQSLERSCATATSVDSLGPVPADCVALPAPAILNLPAPGGGAPRAPHEAGSQQPAGEPAALTTPEPDPVSADSPRTLLDLGEPTPSPTSAEPTSEQAADDPDDGLLDGLNRLLGNLFGK